jgi:acetoin utilization protein AcuB
MTQAVTVGEVMRVEVLTVAPDLSLPELESRLLKRRVGGYPVVENGRLVGIVSRSDIVRQLSVERSVGGALANFDPNESSDAALEKVVASISEYIGRRMEVLTVRDAMITEVITARPDEALVEAARRMLEARVHRLPVVEDGALRGILTSSDFVRLFADGQLISTRNS